MACLARTSEYGSFIYNYTLDYETGPFFWQNETLI